MMYKQLKYCHADTLCKEEVDFYITNVFMLAVEMGHCYLAESSTR